VILDPDETDDEDEDEAEERIGLTDSLMFPVIASITLFSLFLVFKYLDSKWINQILGGYCKPVCFAIFMHGA
jgi:minor histocompatibility antigen H13